MSQSAYGAISLWIKILTIILISTFSSACALITRPPAPQPRPTATLLPPLARAVDIHPEAIVIPIPIDPPSFNAYLNSTGYEELVGELVYGSLVEIDPEGNYYPDLAAEIPTMENGGVSADGLRVTWKIRPGIEWSDGTAFSSSDIYFTWLALRDSGIYAPGFDLIEDIEIQLAYPWEGRN